jgi:hypothetical protein
VVIVDDISLQVDHSFLHWKHVAMSRSHKLITLASNTTHKIV